MIPLEDISKSNEDLIIHQQGKTKVVAARYDISRSGRGYTSFISKSGGSHTYRNDGYGSAWWCQPLIRITKEKWDQIPNDYKGKWDEWIRTQGYQPNLPDEYIGKRTVFEGCITDHAGTALLTEGIHFIIEE